MAIYQRPLRPDELMHWGIGGRGQERPNHKYKERKWVNGAWQYIYDQAGGKYKKQANKLKAESNRDYKISDYNANKSKIYDKAARINKESREAWSNVDRGTPGRLKKMEYHSNKVYESNKKADEYAERSSKAYKSAWNKEHEAVEARRKYKNSLAYKYDAHKLMQQNKKKKPSRSIGSIASKTISTAKKRIASGKKRFNNFLDSLKPHTYVTFSDGTKYRIN